MRHPLGPIGAPRLASLFAGAMARSGLAPGRDRLAVALSGGADSVALVQLVAWWAGSGEGRVRVAGAAIGKPRPRPLFSSPAPPPPAVAAAMAAATARVPAADYGATAPASLAALASAAVEGRPWARPRRPHASPLLPPLALVVDHGLRPGSAVDAARAAGVAAGLGCEAAVVAVEWGGRGGAPRAAAAQAAARDARYASLATLATARGAAVLLTGHHGDDAAETVLLRVLRASGPHGLAGVPPAAWLHRAAAPPLLLLRPLLPVSKSHLLDFVARARLPWLADPSNADARGTPRNALRAALGGAPAAAAAGARGGRALLSKTHPASAAARRVAAAARAAGAGARAHAAALLAAAVAPGPILDVATFAAAPEAVLRDALAAVVEAVAGAPPRGAAVAALAAALAGGRLARAATGGRCVLRPVPGSRGGRATLALEREKRVRD